MVPALRPSRGGPPAREAEVSVFVLLFSLFVAPAHAHRPGISYARVEPESVTLTFARPELGALGPMEDIEASRVLIAEGTLGKTLIAADGAPCLIGEPVLRPVEGDGVEIRADLHCPSGKQRTFTAAYLEGMADGHRAYLDAGGNPVAVLDRGNASATFEQGVSDLKQVAVQWFKLGVGHIWTGYDHLAFLGALLLAAASLRQMLYIVTGFTVAHSITLTLAATGVFALSPSITEPAIAVTIVLVGLENLAKPTPRRRLATTFCLGLVHGFGFAGLLREIGLPRDALAVSLACFNGGVEVGQAAVVAVTLPVLLMLRKRGWWEHKAVPGLSVVIALLGVYWFVQRVFLGG